MGDDDFQWKLALLLFGLLLIVLLAIARHMSIQAGFSRVQTSPERRQLWDRRLLSDFVWFALFECILTICSGTGSARFTTFPIRLFAGIMAFFLLYEFLVPLLFPVSTTSAAMFTDEAELNGNNGNGNGNKPPTRARTGGDASSAESIPSWFSPIA